MVLIASNPAIFLYRLALLWAALVFPLPAAAEPPAGDLLGQEHSYAVRKQDTLYDIARQHGLGVMELAAANPGMDRWQPRKGAILTLPTAHILPPPPREGIVIHLAALRLYYFPKDGGEALSFPVSAGRPCCETPVGSTSVVARRAQPSWTPPDSIRAERPDLPDVVPPGPDNPLGDYALYLGWPEVLIHGTNRPWGIGQAASHGCIRMYPEDIARLFSLVEIGTPVRVMDGPASLGWQEGDLYMEAHPAPAWEDDVDALHEQVRQAAGAQSPRLDWYVIDRALARRDGVPVRVTW